MHLLWASNCDGIAVTSSGWVNTKSVAAMGLDSVEKDATGILSACKELSSLSGFVFDDTNACLIS